VGAAAGLGLGAGAAEEGEGKEGKTQMLMPSEWSVFGVQRWLWCG
jgi:hypothetical protein